jgi:purine-binding chemotaxis protein CheW
MSAPRQFCTFQLADLYLGIEVERVQEVLRYQGMTRVPTASPVVEGLINLRGQIVTAIDLRRRLGLPERPADDRPMNVVVRTEDGIVSLLVDEIGDVLEVDEQTYEAAPATLRGPARELIRGVHKLTRRLLLLLDVEQVLNFDAAVATPPAGG